MKLRHYVWAAVAALALTCMPMAAKADTVYLNVNDGDDITVELFNAVQGGNTVVIPEGKYEISSKIRIGSDTTIKSGSGKVTLTMSGSSDVMMFTPSSVTHGNDNITLQDLILHGEKDTDAILRFYNASKLILSRVQIRNGSGVGVRFNNCKSTTMNNCIVAGNYTEGIAVKDSTVMIKKTTIMNNGHEVFGNTDYTTEGNGISVREGAVVSFKACTIKENGAYGIGVSAGGAIKLQGTKKAPNKVTENSWNGISVTGAGTSAAVNYLNCDGNGTNPRITGDGASGHGMGVSAGATANVKNSTFNNNSKCGLSLFSNGAKLTITKCKLNNNGGHGIGARKGVTLNATSCTTNYNKEHGIMLLDQSEGTLKSITASHNGKENKGLVAGKTSKNVTITGGKFYSNGQDGISLYEITGNVLVDGATMKSNPWYGLRIRSCPKAKVINCKYSKNGRGTYTLS